MKELTEIFRLKAEIGDRIWPGFAKHGIPVVLFNDNFEFLIGFGLGAQSGDLRFYLSGMAQARLLDRLSPGWKALVLPDPAYLDDLIREAVRPKR